jgi:myo-inositol-1(or 4)-monophosphatase
MSYENFLTVALEAAHKGSEALLKYWGKLQNVREKTFAWDLVTEADKESETIIIEVILSHFPSHQILAEESGMGMQQESEYLWIIDPLDGTTNYTHQYPMVSVSIGLMHKQEIIVGVVFNPIFKELFHAVKGSGAQLNGHPIQVSKTDKLSQSLLATGFAYNRLTTPDNNYTEFCRLTNISQGVRRLGSAALDLAYVAAGRLDGYWERGLQPWDLAAGVLLVEEAGGKVSGYEDTPFDLFTGRILATNGMIHQELSKNLIKARETLK